MEPLPLKTRRIFATLFFVLFIVIVPLVVLYASGYRLQGLSVVSTGGVHISAPMSGVTFSLNGEEVGKTSLFSKSVFLNNVEPGSYVVQGSAEGYHLWVKNIVVESRLVTDSGMLAVEQPLMLRELLVATSSDATPAGATSTTMYVSEREYREVLEAFVVATSTEESGEDEVLSIATTTESEEEEHARDISGGAALVIEEGDLTLEWRRDALPPSSFCTRPSLCVLQIPLEEGPQVAVDARFFHGGVVYATETSGIFFIEADIRQPRLLVPLYTAPHAEFRTVEGTLYIKGGETLYVVEGI